MLRNFKTKYIWLAFLFKVIIAMYGTMNLKFRDIGYTEICFITKST